MSSTDKKIVYLFGAGASIGALPIVNEIYFRMEIFKFILSVKGSLSKEFSCRFNFDATSIDVAEKFIKEINKRRTFDTYAKELWLNENNTKSDLINLKNFLKEYLKFEQEYTDDEIRKELSDSAMYKYFTKDYNRTYRYLFSTKEGKNLINKVRLDQRYINFLIDILGDPNSLLKIKLFSWNYDTQFNEARKSLGLDKNNDKDKLGVNKILDSMEIKLNGSIFDEDLKFAWEQNDDRLDKRFKDIGNISDFVIIGYSFPFSNRQIDRKIIERIIPNISSFKTGFVTYPIKDRENIFYRNIHIQVPDKEEFEIIKGKIVNLINSISSVAGYHFTDESGNEIVAEYINTEYGYNLGHENITEKNISRIRFIHQTDNKNFYIPHSY